MKSKFLNEFKQFAMRGNVIDLAVGVIIGGVFSSIVTSLTDNFINPVFRRSTRKVPTFPSFHLSHLFPWTSFFPIFTANFQCPFWAFFIEKNF